MTIEKLPSGNYRGIVQRDGRRATTGAVSTRAEAKVLEAELRLSMGAPPEVVPSHTVGEVVVGYIADGAVRMSPLTLIDYRKAASALPSTFTGREVREVTPVVLDGLYNELRRGGASEHKVGKVHKLLSASLNRAVKYDWLVANPCHQATKPKVRSKEIVPPSPEHVLKLIIDAAHVNPDLPVYFRLLAATGMRRGESVALRWEDFTGDTVFVRRNVVEDGRELVIKDTKTNDKGRRRISIDADTMREVDSLRERQTAGAAEHHLPAPEWVFSHDLGVTQWRPEYVTRAFTRLVKGYRLHDLRHFHATQLLAAGTPITLVSRRLGHSSVVVTLNVYGHWLPQQDRQAASTIAGVLAIT